MNDSSAGSAVLGVVFGLAGIGVGILLLLLGRELVTWYWKVNEAVARLTMIEGVLRNIDKNLIVMADMAQQPSRPAPTDQQWGAKP